MRHIFTQSLETSKLVEFFCSTSINERVSFEIASRSVGFKVTSALPAYQAAKRIAARDHGVVIEGIRKFGFTRLSGSQMLGLAPKFFQHVQRGSRRQARVQEIAISSNLDRAEMAIASEQLGRLRIIEATSSPLKASSNRPDRAAPEAIKA